MDKNYKITDELLWSCQGRDSGIIAEEAECFPGHSADFWFVNSIRHSTQQPVQKNILFLLHDIKC